jgi:hypothetical protein
MARAMTLDDLTHLLLKHNAGDLPSDPELRAGCARVLTCTILTDEGKIELVYGEDGGLELRGLWKATQIADENENEARIHYGITEGILTSAIQFAKHFNISTDNQVYIWRLTDDL